MWGPPDLGGDVTMGPSTVYGSGLGGEAVITQTLRSTVDGLFFLLFLSLGFMQLP